MKFNQRFFWVVISLLSFFVAGSASAQISQLKGDPHSPDKRPTSQVLASCPIDALEADVVAIDHPIVFNRLGAQNVNWMMYALRHDLVYLNPNKPNKMTPLDYTVEGNRLFKKVQKKHTYRNIALRPDLRPRPLVLRVAEGDYLKVNFTNLLHVKLKHHEFSQPNFANPFDYPDPLKGMNHPLEHAPRNEHKDPDTGYPLSISDLHKIYTSDDQVASRYVGFHPQGLELVTSIDDDSSYVGKNKNSLAPPAPGETRTYCFRAEKEGAYLVSSDGAVFGGEGTSGNSGVGLFGAVIVEPKDARFYRAQVTEEEMRLATWKDTDDKGDKTPRLTPDGHPVINYEAIYNDDCAANGVWCQEGKAGRPILNMVQKNRIIHGDINAMIIGPNDDGSFPKDTYPLESIGARNPSLPNRLEPFREFVSIFHDENAATQAFPYFFEHPELSHTLHGVRDAFMINYGSGGVGAEIIANRLEAGPMHDCLDCAYEEFFLSSFAVGDAAMLVDKPANLVISQCQPEYVQMVEVEDPENPTGKKKIPDPKYSKEREDFCKQKPDQRATEAYYPHDPANVHHSYIGDFVKFRNLHSGKEQHIFHLHNHQWLFNPNDDNSNYIDAQGIGPGSGYTYEIAFGGSGNRNKTVGDAIFHCHFYPHFAQGMWYMWRNHDVFEAGTKLAVSESKDPAEPNLTKDYHKKPFELMFGKPSKTARALPDGEIVAGVPIPAIVPLPGKGMAPMPLDVSVKPRIGLDGKEHGSVTVVDIPEKSFALPEDFLNRAEDNDQRTRPNPGYPFWIAGVSYYTKAGKEVDQDRQFVSMGARPTTPPLDMCNEKNCPKLGNKTSDIAGHDGGLPRHALAGYSAHGKTHSEMSKFTAEKLIEKAMPVYYSEEGTKLEQMAMAYHAKRKHDTHMVDVAGNVFSSKFIVNGAAPTPGAPFNEPCMDDEGEPLHKGGDGRFFGGAKDMYIYAKSSLLPEGIEYGADNPRIYKGANIQLDVVFNKLGYHYPQQRILALWEDVGSLLDVSLPEATLKGRRPKAPEPLVLRMNTFDCAMYAHTNLIPAAFYADDYQITTPTDVIGQHIHLPKWDLTSADGSANGWNYEDGTFSPDMVRERIHAINKWNNLNPERQVKTLDGTLELIPVVHPYFNGEKIPAHQKPIKSKDEKNSEDKNPYCVELWEDTLQKARIEAEKNCKDNQNFNYRNKEECINEKEYGVAQFQFDYGMPGECNWLGARTTLQRWFSDPIVNRKGIHRGLGTTFTHDHLGPSTHQQLGLYATMLTEPPGSVWWSNELNSKSARVKLYDRTERSDGGPTSWQALITGKDGQEIDVDGDGGDDSHREFFLQFGDFQHAYVQGAYYGVSKRGIGWPWEGKDSDSKYPNKKKAEPTPDSFRFAINPSVRKPARPVFPDILAFEPTCPGGKGSEVLPGAIYNVVTNFNDSTSYKEGKPLRPCPEAISADDVGMMVVNYRNEPIGARVYDPNKRGPDGKKGTQAEGEKGDLAFAMQTRTDRAIASLNTTLGNTRYEALTSGVYHGDPFTPILQAHSGDRIKIKIQGGSHEHEHNASINGLSWLQAGSGYGQAPHSGWRNSQNAGLSEQFTFTANLVDYESPFGMNDRMYTIDSSQDGLWNGVWGVLRSYNRVPVHQKLMPLASNPIPTLLAPSRDGERIDNVCPSDAPIRSYTVSAVLANKALVNSVGATIPNWKSKSYRWWEWEWWQPATRSHLDSRGGTLVYNPRSTQISIGIYDKNGELLDTKLYGTGPLHDPTAIMLVRDEDLENGRLKPGVPVEPLVLRAAAGDCIQITLKNQLPKNSGEMPDLDGFTSVSGIIPRNCSDLGIERTNNCNRNLLHDRSATSFNNNLIKPSNSIGLHPQMAHYDVQASDGNNVGFNSVNTVVPGGIRRYTWYAGTVEIPRDLNKACLVEGDVAFQEAYKTLNYFALPIRKTSLSSIDLFSDANFNKTITEFKVRHLDSLDDEYFKFKINEIFQSGNTTFFSPANLNNEQIKKIIMDHYKKWRTSDDSLGDDIAYYFKELWLRAKNTLQDSQCTSELGHSDLDAIEKNTFDRGKIIKALARCFEADKESLEILWPISQYTTRLISLEKGKSSDECEPARFVAIEYGGGNLTPPDRIKQGQKGAIGALVIEPEGASWEEKDKALDRQQHSNAGKINLRYTRTMADVAYRTATGERKFRDLVMVHQKGLNLRYKDGSAVQNLASEKEKIIPEDLTSHLDHPLNSAPEDAHDSGHMAINYGAEPLWFRFGLPPDAPFGKSGFGGADSAWQAFSNDCCSNGADIGTVISAAPSVGEPYVPIMKAYAGQEMRIRALMPTGTGRGSTVELHGHSWMRDPYLAEYVEEIEYDDTDEKNNRIKRQHSLPRGGNQYGFYDEKRNFHLGWGAPSKCIGENALAMYLGGQESLTPMAHFDLIFPRAGGKHGVKGDYLWRDHGGFGITNGLWALIRIEDAPKDKHYGEKFAPQSLRTNCTAVAINTASQ